MKNNHIQTQSIGTEAAIALAGTNWWEGKTHREIAGFQLFTDELCCPFGIFHEALEASLGRPVWTHELGMNADGIRAEFNGETGSPSFEDILNLIHQRSGLLSPSNQSLKTKHILHP